MYTRLIGSIVLAALLYQGWVQTAVAAPAETAPMEHCAGDAADGRDHGCCPDDVGGASDCQTHCSMSPALTMALAAVAPARGAPPSLQLPPNRAGPSYLPPNPPPNA